MKSKLFLLFLALCFIQCDDFLEEQSQSEVRPSTVSDMEKILESGAYPTEEMGALMNRKTEIFTDNVRSNIVEAGYQAQKENEMWRFRWDLLMFNEDGGGNDISFWKVPYERIMGCNLVLEYIDQMAGSDVKKAHIKGESYVLRGLYYYILVNFFGVPYNYGDPTINSGVPLKLNTGVTDEKFKRNSVAECYEQILEDLETGTRLMKEGQEAQSNDVLRLRYPVGWALLSRVCLHMNKWDEVICYADSVLDIHPQLFEMKSATSYSSGVYDSRTPMELLWCCVEKDEDTMALYPCSPSEELLDLYVLYDIKEGLSDLRIVTSNTFAYFVKPTWGDYAGIYVNSKKGVNGTYWVNGGIRTAEVYLNRAEAYIRKYIETHNEEDAYLALNDLNELRRNRLSAGYVDMTMADFTNADELLEFCLRERRRELCYEGNHRWFDLRRLGMPEITHIFLDNDNGHETKYVLQKNDSRYVLPIPGEVLRRNPNLTEIVNGNNK
ncbi:RagB/SusD family nutrient uptake outer membrane protein [Butyricimonas hominis]|uniref:RagB/SusD family nutrient uptake outer membrane protein n=1 Tax=Butyricimonas hominis TaxID=2763032 RepID=A0ABR7D256_9BACT|nr:RagB/SusD family nutrient uptake outer membrane protein [Butyricimonas hominis]MBC5622025.1 RagB/SusD family nutrient uptake outer membrane protein [Butyricimonas hominis]